MADRLRSDGSAFLTEPVPDWLLPAPFADVWVASAEMADWVLTKGRRPILERGVAHPQTAPEFLPSPSRGIAELAGGLPSPPNPLSHQIDGRGGVSESLTLLATTAGKRAIDLGCGAGRDAFWLQAHGWQVLGVDRLPPQADIPFVLANLHEFRTDEQFDLVLLHYCWDPEYLELALGLCKLGGRVSILAHSELHWRCFGHPRKSKVFSESGFINVLFPGLRTLNVQHSSEFNVIESEEFWSLDRHSVRIVLERRK